MFSYEYTKDMEYDLDKISSGEIMDWANICRNCVSEIKRQSQTIKSISKQSYPIEEGYEFIYEKYGPAIKHTLEDGTVEYITANKDVNLEKIQRGEYSLNELIEVKDKKLGTYENEDLYIKNGRYGMYVEYGEKRVSVKAIQKKLEEIELDDVIEIIENAPKEKFMLRKLNEYMDIRRGQYGPYVFYYRPNMKKPKFLNIKKCPHGFLTCSVETLVEWLCNTYNLPSI